MGGIDWDDLRYVLTVADAGSLAGAARNLGVNLAGQQIETLFVDRYGWFRLPMREISSLRFRGVALLLVGVAIIQVL
jgi:transporter family-2 protein